MTSSTPRERRDGAVVVREPGAMVSGRCGWAQHYLDRVRPGTAFGKKGRDTVADDAKKCRSP